MTEDTRKWLRYATVAQDAMRHGHDEAILINAYRHCSDRLFLLMMALTETRAPALQLACTIAKLGRWRSAPAARLTLVIDNTDRGQ